MLFTCITQLQTFSGTVASAVTDADVVRRDKTQRTFLRQNRSTSLAWR